jgi:hypothetical protein
MSLLSLSVYSTCQQMPLLSISFFPLPTDVSPLVLVYSHSLSSLYEFTLFANRCLSSRYELTLTVNRCLLFAVMFCITTAILFCWHLGVGVSPSFRICRRCGWLCLCLSFIYLTPDVSPSLYPNCLYLRTDVSICLPVNRRVFSLCFSYIYFLTESGKKACVISVSWCLSELQPTVLMYRFIKSFIRQGLKKS